MRNVVAITCFFLSGFAGLVYEVCWIRQASAGPRFNGVRAQHRAGRLLGASFPLAIPMVVSIGAGQTPSRFLMYDMDRVDCVDIEPRVFEPIRDYFKTDWMNDARVGLVCADDHNFLAHGAAIYRDDRPVLEYDTSRVAESQLNELANVKLLRDRLERVQSVLPHELSSQEINRIGRLRERNLARVQSSVTRATRTSVATRRHRR